MTQYHGSGAFNLFLSRSERASEQCNKYIKAMAEESDTPILAIIVGIIWYLIETFIFLFLILVDLLKGKPFWDLGLLKDTNNKNNVTQLLRKEDYTKQDEYKKIHSPRPICQKPVVNYSTMTEMDEAVHFIESVLKANNGTLKGVVISTTERKIPEDELLQFTTLGYLTEPAMKQFVSFGSVINEKLHKILGKESECTYVSRKKNTCFVLNNGDYTPIVNKLNEVLHRTDVKINLTGC